MLTSFVLTRTQQCRESVRRQQSALTNSIIIRLFNYQFINYYHSIIVKAIHFFVFTRTRVICKYFYCFVCLFVCVQYQFKSECRINDSEFANERKANCKQQLSRDAICGLTKVVMATAPVQCPSTRAAAGPLLVQPFTILLFICRIPVAPSLTPTCSACI